MKLLFFGDLVGRKSVSVLCNKLNSIINQCSIDFVVVNAENSCDGFGITPDICDELLNSGVNVITLGDHAWDRQQIIDYIKIENRVLRPMNLSKHDFGLSYNKYSFGNNNEFSIIVAEIMGQVFIDNGNTKKVSSPFKAVDTLLSKYALINTLKNNDVFDKEIVNAIFIDIHAEATSEKMALAHYVDGRVSAVIGTHTHVPTADACIFSKGTAYQTDAGMCGDYDSSIGMTANSSLNLFIERNPDIRLTVADNDISLCGVIIDIENQTGLANSINSFILSNRLKSTHSI